MSKTIYRCDDEGFVQSQIELNIELFSHPDGMGRIEAGDGVLVVSNDEDSTMTQIFIGRRGLRILARKLNELADLLEGGV